MKQYETKDSGQRIEYASGMKRDLSEGKPRPDLITDEMMRWISWIEPHASDHQVLGYFRQWKKGVEESGVGTVDLLSIIADYGKLDKHEMILRLGGVLERGGRKYGFYNWQKANSQEELDRFYESAERHLVMWLAGIDDEDHLAGFLYNVMCAEWLKQKLKEDK